MDDQANEPRSTKALPKCMGSVEMPLHASSASEWDTKQGPAYLADVPADRDPSPKDSGHPEESTTSLSSSAANSTSASPASASVAQDDQTDSDSVGNTRVAPVAAAAMAQSHPDEEMGVASLDIASLGEACETSELDNATRQPQDVKTDQAKEQAEAEDLAVSVESAPGDQLVQATLIRDIDDSNHSDDFNSPPSARFRETSSGAMVVESDMAVVEAKPVEPAPTKTMSRKLICAVMGMLLLVIGALSVGFVVSAKKQGGGDSSGSSSDDEDAATKVSETPSPPPVVLQSPSPTATPIPVLQRLREEGGSIRCGVIPGPGLFYPNEGGEPYGFDASLVSQCE